MGSIAPSIGRGLWGAGVPQHRTGALGGGFVGTAPARTATRERRRGRDRTEPQSLSARIGACSNSCRQELGHERERDTETERERCRGIPSRFEVSRGVCRPRTRETLQNDFKQSPKSFWRVPGCPPARDQGNPSKRVRGRPEVVLEGSRGPGNPPKRFRGRPEVVLEGPGCPHPLRY